MTKLERAHLNALSLLIQPLVECKGGKPITPMQASDILYEWDQARKVKGDQ